MPREMIAKLKARGKSERGRTSRDADAGPNSARKPRPDTNLISPSTIRGDQSEKLKIGMRPRKHTTLHMPRFES